MNVIDQKPTAEQQYAAVAEKMAQLGFRVPAKDAWRKTIGSMKGSQAFLDAIKFGAEWRAEENRKSLAGLDADS